MSKLMTIGLDLAKNVFHVVGVDAHGQRVCRKRLRCAQVLGYFSQLPPCRVGMEACPGAHYWGRDYGLRPNPTYDCRVLESSLYWDSSAQ
jgi:hypothetical protein